MENVKSFFFLTGITANVQCDFKRDGEKIVLLFCHCNDKPQNDVLEIAVRTEMSIFNNLEFKNHYLTYKLQNQSGIIKQSDSRAIRNVNDVWAIVVCIVNDVFQE